MPWKRAECIVPRGAACAKSFGRVLEEVGLRDDQGGRGGGWYKSRISHFGGLNENFQLAEKKG